MKSKKIKKLALLIYNEVRQNEVKMISPDITTSSSIATSSLFHCVAELQVLTASGTAGVATAALAGNITAVSGTTYLVDCSAARTITLPAAVNNATFTVKDTTPKAAMI